MSDLQCPARVFVARHGQATYAVDDVVTDAGGTLTDLGRHQAADLAERLVPERIAVVYPSRLDRAVQTGAIVATRLGTPIEVLDGVHEFAAGSLEGHHWDEALRRGCYDAWLAGELDERWPGGESGREIVDRMRLALDAVADRHRGEAVLVVSHGGVMSLSLPLLAMDAAGPRIARPPLPNTAVVALSRDGDGWRLAAPWPGTGDVRGPRRGESG
ncbi:MAG: histidine phosphatase family protein [Dermatophilaceae bacterium]